MISIFYVKNLAKILAILKIIFVHKWPNLATSKARWKKLEWKHCRGWNERTCCCSHFSCIVGFILSEKNQFDVTEDVFAWMLLPLCMFNQEWSQLMFWLDCNMVRRPTWLRPYARIFSSTKSIITLFCSSFSLQVNICRNLFSL